jgi:hypothetical protein
MAADCPQTERKNLTDHAHRLRLTSILMSILCFGLSIPTRCPFDGFDLFGAKLGGTNKEFIVTGILAAALISFTSFALSFFDEIPGVIESRRHLHADAIRLQNVDSKLEDILFNISETGKRVGILSDVHQPGFRLPLLDIEFFLRGFTANWSESNTAYFLEMLFDSGFPDLYEKKGDAYGLVSPEVIKGRLRSAFEVILFEKKCEWDSRDGLYPEVAENPAWMASKAVWQLLEVVRSNNHESGSKLTQILSELRGIRSARKHATTRSLIQSYVLDFGVPSAVFGIATLHALGALGLMLLPALPDMFPSRSSISLSSHACLAR